MLQPTTGTHRSSVIKSNFEQDRLDKDHEYGLNKQRLVVVSTKPVEDPGIVSV